MAPGTGRAHLQRGGPIAAICGCLAIAIAAGAAHSSSTPVPSFAANKSYRTGGYPKLAGVTDLNGDGKPDLVTLEGRRLSVLLNRGHGTFGHRRDYETGPSPDASVLGDLNGDSRPDLITASRPGTISVVLNRGDGSFGASHDFSTGSGLQGLELADLNRDGNADLVNLHGGTLSVFVGNGDGTFEPRRDYGSGFDPESPLAVADLNGDSSPDLVAMSGGTIAVAVLLNNGDGTFGPPHSYKGGGFSLAVGDLNGDGRPDLAGATPAGEGWVSVLLNHGDGSFGRAHDYTFKGGIIPGGGGGPASVQIADLNGDGKADLVTSDEEAGGGSGVGLSVLLNRGGGTFGKRTDYPLEGDLSSVAIGDTNGDGKPDLAVANANTSTVALFLNKGDGHFQWRRQYPTEFLPDSIVLADLNGDGRADFLTANDSLAGGTLSVLLFRPGLCNVQDVAGMRPARAKWALARVNCRAATRRVFDPKHRWPKGGLVEGQRPGFGTVLPAGGKVRLLVRFGRAG